MVGKVLKRPEVGKFSLPPRLFRQAIEPKHVSFNRDLLAYDKEQFYQKDALKKDAVKRVFRHCIGHFWDNDAKRAVELDLGRVNVFCKNDVYRAAPSSGLSPEFDDEPANVLSWGEEGAAPCAFVADEYRPERSEDGTESAKTVVDKYQGGQSGSYVIPGQTLPWDKTAQKTGGQTPMGGNI